MLLRRGDDVTIGTAGTGLASMHGACVWENGTKASVWTGPQATRNSAAAAATCAARPDEWNALSPRQAVVLDSGDDGRGRLRRCDDRGRLMGGSRNERKGK